MQLRVAFALLALAAAAPAAPATAGPVLPGTTELVSVSSTGRQAYVDDTSSNTSNHASLSADGRIVTFTSNAKGLVSDDCGQAAANTSYGDNVYARDLVKNTTELVSVTVDGCPSLGSGLVGTATSSVSADGRYVAFTSVGYFVPGFHQTRETVYVRDRVLRRTVVASIGVDGRPNNGDAEYPAISGNGRFVVFESSANNLVRNNPRWNPDAGVMDLFVRDLWTGRTERVAAGYTPGSLASKSNASISYDGRWIAFETADSRLFGTTDYGPTHSKGALYSPGTGPTQILLYDRITRRLRLASHSPQGWAANHACDLGEWDAASNRTLSADGRYVVFICSADNLMQADPEWALRELGYDLGHSVYCYDRVTDALTRVSVGPGGIKSNGPNYSPAISADGNVVVYSSGATNLGEVDPTHGELGPMHTPDSLGYDVYRWDRRTGAQTLVSRSTLGAPGVQDSIAPSVNGDGSVVAFQSFSATLVPGDTNGLLDVFVHRMR